jgi:hypothetical protein
MVSDASKKKAASKKAAAAEKRGSKSAAAVAQSKLKDVQNGVSNDAAVADEMAALMITDRTCTGVLASHPQSRDIHVSFAFVSCCLIWDFCSWICCTSLARLPSDMRAGEGWTRAHLSFFGCYIHAAGVMKRSCMGGYVHTLVYRWNYSIRNRVCDVKAQ